VFSLKKTNYHVPTFLLHFVLEMPRSENDVLFDKYREQAQFYSTKSNVYSQQSQQAFKRGDKQLAKTLSKQSKKFKSLAIEENQAAAKKIFEFHNANKNNNEVDLHGLFVSEAIEFLSKRVDTAVSSNQSKLIVIVGRGLHSQGGPKVKPAVIKFAKQHEIQHDLDSPNAGCITFLFRDRGISPKNRKPKQSGRRTNRHDTVIQIVDSNQNENYENGNEESGNNRCLLLVIIFVLAVLLFGGAKSLN
jgi:DNA-nicking Smr family endonuclease